MIQKLIDAKIKALNRVFNYFLLSMMILMIGIIGAFLIRSLNLLLVFIISMIALTMQIMIVDDYRKTLTNLKSLNSMKKIKRSDL